MVSNTARFCSVANARARMPPYRQRETRRVAQWTGGSIPEGKLPYESAGRTKDFWIDANKAEKSKVLLTRLLNRNRWDGCTIDRRLTSRHAAKSSRVHTTVLMCRHFIPYQPY
jgi:hypothetical protein